MIAPYLAGYILMQPGFFLSGITTSSHADHTRGFSQS